MGNKMNDWYLIQFKPNSYQIAQRNLLRQGFKTFLPMQQITRRNASRFVSDLQPLFPGYMFVCVNSELAPWRAINSTIGVSKIVGFEGKPKVVPLQLISGIMRRCDGLGRLLSSKSLSEGDSVEVRTGPFVNFIATVDKIDPEQRIWILMDFMGQKSRMQVSADQLQMVK
jgi:transcriptional antiterminator RfaH